MDSVFSNEVFNESIKAEILKPLEGIANVCHIDDIFPVIQKAKDENTMVSSDWLPAVAYTIRHYECKSDVEEFCHLDENQELKRDIIDYRTCLPITLRIELWLVSYDVNDIIKMESAITDYFKCEKEFSIADNYHTIVSAKLADDKISREKRTFGGGDLLFSLAFLTIEGGIVDIKRYHPAELSFNNNLKDDALEQLSTIINRIGVLSNRSRAQDDTTKSIINDFLQIRDERICALFEVESIEEYKKQYGKNAVLYIPEYVREMNKNHIGFSEAIESFNNRKKEFDALVREREKEKKEKERKELLFHSKGDPESNKKADKVVELICDILSEENIKVYGGSTHMEWEKKMADGTIEFPCMLIVDHMRVNFGQGEYYTTNENQTPIRHYCDWQSVPIKQAFRFNVYYPEVCDVQSVGTIISIESIINDFFKEEKNISVDDTIFDGEKSIIKIKVDNSSEKVVQQSVHKYEINCMCEQIKSVEYDDVYHYIKPTSKELLNNTMLKLRMLQVLEFLVYNHTTITNKGIYSLNNSYKNLLLQQGTPKPLFSGFWSTPEYKELAAAFRERRPIDKNMFNSFLSNITSAYPFLYDRMIAGWTIPQIQAEMEAYAKPMKEKSEELIKLLEIPDTVETFSTVYKANDLNAIRFYLNTIAKDLTVDIPEAVKMYEAAILKAEREKAKERARRQEEAQYEREREAYEDRGNSSGGGILSTAAGVALGNKISGNTHKGKPDLIGTAGCAKSKGGGCTALCPLYRDCCRGWSKR